jgi:predicted DNA-binding ArsR family transcriptional regulator
MLLPPMGEPFMYKIKEDEMIVVSLGYLNYVLSNKDAVALAEILEKAELYEAIWIPSGERNVGGPDHTYHVYENDKQVDMKLISADLYRMAKLAGKPEKK